MKEDEKDKRERGDAKTKKNPNLRIMNRNNANTLKK